MLLAFRSKSEDRANVLRDIFAYGLVIPVLPKLRSVTTFDTMKFPWKSHSNTRVRETNGKALFANDVKHQINVKYRLSFALIHKLRFFRENIVIETETVPSQRRKAGLYLQFKVVHEISDIGARHLT